MARSHLTDGKEKNSWETNILIVDNSNITKILNYRQIPQLIQANSRDKHHIIRIYVSLHIGRNNLYIQKKFYTNL